MNKARFSRRRFLRGLGLGAAAVSLPGCTNWRNELQAGGKSKPVRILVVSDGHYGQSGTDYRVFHEAFLGWVEAERSRGGLDAVVLNGDLSHDEPWMLEELRRDYLDRLPVPWYAARGNHDRVTAEQWTVFSGRPLNHSVDLGACACIFADSSDETGAYLCADIDWIEAEAARFPSDQPILLFIHIAHKPWTRTTIDCPEVMSRLVAGGRVQAVFHGHDHNTDSWFDESGVPFFFSGHMGGSWGVPYRGYRIVEISRGGHLSTAQIHPPGMVQNRYP